MKRRILAMLLAAVLILSMTACGGRGNDQTENPDTVSQQNTSDDKVQTDNGETYNIIMQIVTFGNEFTGFADVEAAINAITEPEIGVTVTLSPVMAWDLPTTSALEITSNEKLDLMCILPLGAGMDSIANYASKNMLLPLDELLDQYGQDISECLGSLLDIGYYSGNLYAVPPNYMAGSGSGFVARTDLLDELGYSFDVSQTYTLEDIEKVFAAYKDAYGSGYYPIAAFGDGNPFLSVAAIDNLGTDLSDGVLIDGGMGELKVVNVFETEVYAEYISQARSWYLNGYFNPDVVTIVDDWVTLVGSGNYLGAFTTYPGDGMDTILQNSISAGYDLTPIRLVEDYATTGKAANALWAIPVTCENPEKTMQFLNLLYQERELADDIDSLLAAGIEGSCYVIEKELEGSRVIVDYPEGVDSTNVPYSQTLPIYGNQFTIPKYRPLDESIYEQMETYNQSLESAGRYSKAFGYVFDSTLVANQKAALQSVVTQYEALLGFGAVDPDEVLPEFIDAMKTAGIDEVIAENQKQLDEWLAGK